MLNMSRFETGTLRPNFRDVNLTDIVIQTVLMFEKKIEDKHLEVEGLGSDRMSAEVDPDLIQQVIYNLVENAVKFINDGGILSFRFERSVNGSCTMQIRETAPIPQKVKGRVPCNVVSTHDAEITSILARNGFAMFKKGDYVPKGALLISGVIQSKTGRTSVSHAMGEVRGIYNETVSFSGAYRSAEQTLTGRTDTQRTLRLFNLEIPLYFVSTRFRNSTSDYSESPLILFGKKLPISIKRRKLSETVRNERLSSPEELKDKLMYKVYLYEKNFLGDVKIISRDIKTSSTDETLTLSVSYKLEGEIGRQQEIFIK